MDRPGLLRSLVVALVVSCGLPACTVTHADAGTQAAPADVTAAVKKRLCDERVRDICDLAVTTGSDGTVVLSGRTYTQAEADRAVQIARTTPGVSAVSSKIQALPATPR